MMKLTLTLLALGLALGVAGRAQNSPMLFSNDGQARYLGNLSANQFDPNSTSNPFGQYGSPFSPTSINNPFGQYGSPFSPFSANNPFATQAPMIFGPPAGSFGFAFGSSFAQPFRLPSFGAFGFPR
jgi:hypothetical protein